MSGLSCAVMLKRYGINPTVFEANGSVGDSICKNCITLRIFTRSFHNYFKYIHKKYGLDITPLHEITKIKMHSPGKTVTVSGKLGHSMLRGLDASSIENQLAARAGVDIQFDRYVNLPDIAGNFDKIVVAAGYNNISEMLGVWTDNFTAMSRHATVLGEFDPGCAEIWLDTRYAKNTFCYLIPMSTREASIVLVVDDISHREIDTYWNRFLEIENIKYPAIELKDAVHKCGDVYPYSLGNIYIMGNAAGLTDNFAGFGNFNAIESGILAAKAIAENLDYNKLIEPISKNVRAINQCREAIRGFENKNFDRLLTFLDFPPVKYFIYKNPFFRATQGLYIVKAWNSNKSTD